MFVAFSLKNFCTPSIMVVMTKSTQTVIAPETTIVHNTSCGLAKPYSHQIVLELLPLVFALLQLLFQFSHTVLHGASLKPMLALIGQGAYSSLT